VAAFYGVENWRGKHAWETYRRQREAKGDSFEWSSIVPPTVPDAENFAAIPLFAELFPKPPEHPGLEAIKLPDCPNVAGDWRVGRVENLAAWQACFSNNNLLASLSKYDPILNEIANATHRPKCRFPIRYEDNIDMLLPHLSYIRHVALGYRLRALAELSTGHSDFALKDVRLCLALAKALEGEPLEISFLVRIAILERAIQPLWEGLSAHRWTDGQLAELQGEFERVDQFDALAKAMRGERLFTRAAMRQLIDKPHERLWGLTWMSNNSFVRLLGQKFGWSVPTGWMYQNMLTADQFYVADLPSVVDWQHRRVILSSNTRIESSFAVLTPYNIFGKMLIGSKPIIVRKTAQSQTALAQAAIACALERYQLAKGELPENLTPLVPKFIAQVPHDVIDGQPLRYRRTAADQFLLYSVGWNGTDDNGEIALLTGSKPPRTDFDKGDWVWSSARQD